MFGVVLFFMKFRLVSIFMVLVVWCSWMNMWLCFLLCYVCVIWMLVGGLMLKWWLL